MHKLLILLFILLSCPSQAATPLLEQSQQLILVLTPDWDSFKGQLQVYQRSQQHKAWRKQGASISVVVGRQGMAWGYDLAKNNWPGPIKKEGDLRTPMGIFKLSPAFGFDTQPQTFKMDYFQVDENSVCVDDKNSQYYNQLVDASKISQRDWKSAEWMRQIPFYQWGARVQYNTDHPQAGAGSCIFFHIWQSPEHGTAGCVAMAASSLLKVLTELDPAQNPVVVLLTLPVYADVKNAWNLPHVLNNHAASK